MSLDLSIPALRARYLGGSLTPLQMVEAVHTQMLQEDAKLDRHIWIRRLSLDEMRTHAARLDGRDPRYTIGSVNAAEFAVAFASGVTFLLFEGVNSWQVVLGLMLGGIVAAPLGAFLVNKVNRRPMLILVGSLVIFLGLKVLLKIVLQ